MTSADYRTPVNERSFSGLIDRAILETGRGGSILPTAVQYANLTVRECQALGLFAADLLEDQITATAAAHVFTKPSYWRSLFAAQYTTQACWPKLRMPGRQQDDRRQYFYTADNYYVFNGVMVGEVINTIAYYWRKPLLYYGRLGVDTTNFTGGSYNKRKAYFDIETDIWMYLNVAEDAYVADLGNDAEEELRQRNAMNWLLSDWFDVILEGTKAKIFKQFGDNARGGLSFSLYESNKALIRTTASFAVESAAMSLGNRE